jgi:hypothetical protein
MFFTFPEDTRWNAERQAAEFGVEIGEYRGVVRVPRRAAAAPGAAYPERCVEAYYLQRTRFESIAERKFRRRQLAEDRNVEISGAGLALGARIGSFASSTTALTRRVRAGMFSIQCKGDHPTLIARTSAARSSTGIMGNSPGLLTGRLRR